MKNLARPSGSDQVFNPEDGWLRNEGKARKLLAALLCQVAAVGRLMPSKLHPAEPEAYEELAGRPWLGVPEYTQILIWYPIRVNELRDTLREWRDNLAPFDQFVDL